MSSEKAAAFTESWLAMTQQSWRANQALTTALFRAFWSPGSGRSASTRVGKQLHSAALGILNNGIGPVHRKVTANAKRLGRMK